MYNKPHNCRCDVCRKGHAERIAKFREKRRGQEPPQGHGHYGSYSNWGCRCEACSEAWRLACERFQKTGSYADS